MILDNGSLLMPSVAAKQVVAMTEGTTEVPTPMVEVNQGTNMEALAQL